MKFAKKPLTFLLDKESKPQRSEWKGVRDSEEGEIRQS